MLENKIVQYIYRTKRSKGGKTIISREKIGCLVAGVTPSIPNVVQIGFSKCHKNDKYDYIGKRKVPGHGIKIAEERAMKWSCWNNNTSIVVPEIYSIKKDLQKFKERCISYYKDKELTEWVQDMVV